MVVLLDGSSDHDEYMWSEKGNRNKAAKACKFDLSLANQIPELT